ncbi:TetR/AcrR family transcriptional regulator [Bacillus sp. JJ664]
MRQSNRPLGRPHMSNQKKPTKVIILENAVKLFLKRGYQLVSMDDVAKECDVTKATVYYYYSTKAELFTDAMVQMMIRISDRIKEILSIERPLKDNLLEIVKIHLQATFDIDLKTFIKDAKVSLTDEQMIQMNVAEEKMYEVIEIAIENAMNKGEIPQGNSKFATHAFFAILKVGNVRDMNNHSIINSIDEMANEIVNFFWRGLSV